MRITAKRYVFSVTQLCVHLLLGSAQDTIVHNALEELTSVEKNRVAQGKTKLGYGINHRLQQHEITGSLISVAMAEVALLRALHSVTAHMRVRWLHPSPQHRLSALGMPWQPPSSLDPPPSHTHLNSCLKSYPQAIYTIWCIHENSGKDPVCPQFTPCALILTRVLFPHS